MSAKEELLELLRPAGQEHVLRYWDELTAEQQASLHDQIMHEILPTLPAGDGFVHLNNVYRQSNRVFIEGPAKGAAAIEPPTAADVVDITDEAKAKDSALASLVELRDRHEGLRAIRDRRCAVVILAGGAGTRLGQSYPKGMLVCPLLRQQKSLFELHCEKVRRIETLAGADAGSVQVVFMTSDATDKQTREFFAANGNFGLTSAQLRFTMQSSLPCFCETSDPAVGKIILAEKHRIAMAPGGNAGVYEALARGGCLERFTATGVTHAQIFTVDNILARIADPDFFGFALRTGADVVVKSTPKAHDHEAVGVFAKTGGKWGVVEYTEIGNEMAEARDAATGERLYNCANIAIHLCSLSFLQLVAEKMKAFYVYHIAKKPIPTAVSDGVQGSSGANGAIAGVKMEAFIFDLFQFCEPDKFRIVQVDRSSEFSAIKNADDPNKRDSPTTAVKDLQRLHFKWALTACRRAGLLGAGNGAPGEGIDEGQLDALEKRGDTDGIVEVSGLVSFAGENLYEHATAFLERVKAVLSGSADRPHDVLLILPRTERGVDN